MATPVLVVSFTDQADVVVTSCVVPSLNVADFELLPALELWASIGRPTAPSAPPLSNADRVSLLTS